MIRLTGQSGRRIGESTTLTRSWAGSEANVAVLLSNLGFRSRFVTRLPDSPLADSCDRDLRKNGVEVLSKPRVSGRFGAFYLEPGAMFRSPSVTYDRTFSAIAESDPQGYDWDEILASSDWFHVSGITPALSEKTRTATIDAVRTARRLRIPVSLDLNYRRQLWVGPHEARNTMKEIIPYCDVILGNEEDFALMVTGEDSIIEETVVVQAARFRQTAATVFQKHSHLRRLYSSIRIARSVEHNTWSGIVVDSGGDSAVAPTRELRNIVDRVGAGDAFSGGAICGELLQLGLPETVSLGAALGATAHTVFGDFLSLGWNEAVKTTIADDDGGRIKR